MSPAPPTVPKERLSSGTMTLSSVGSGGAPTLNVTGNLDTLMSEFGVQKNMMDFMTSKVNEFLGLAALRTQVIQLATRILKVFLQPLSMINPGNLDPSGVFEGLESVVNTMGNLSSMISDASSGVQEIVNLAEDMTNNMGSRAQEIREVIPDNAVVAFKNESEFGIRYAGGFESSRQAVTQVTQTSIQVGIDTTDFVNSLKQNIENMNSMVTNFKDTAAQVKQMAKEVTDSTDSVKDFVGNLDILNRIVLALVSTLATPPPTWGVATLFLSFDTGVMEWVKTILAELQEIQDMVNSMSNTMEAMQQQMEQPMARLGIPYGG